MEKKYDLNFIDKVFDQQEKRGDLKEIKLKTGSTVQDTIYDVKNTKPPIIQTIIEQLENNVIKNLISEKEFPESYNLINSVSDIVQDMGYYLIPPESRIQYPLDLLAFRLLEINKKVTIILLIPIIIDTNHFNILVSEQTIRYDTNDHTKINPFGEQLEQVAEALFKELVTEQHIFQIIKSKLNTHISIEKTIERRPLYFQSGKVECKIRVDPILINEYTPLFSEKALSFAYQRQSNLHIIGLNQISKLLGFLEQKYITLGSLEKKGNTIQSYESLKERYSSYFKRIQVPFIVYLVLFGIILLSNLPLLTNIMISLGYAAISVYLLSSGFLYYLIFREKMKMAQEFLTPSHKKIMDISDDELFLISTSISPEYLEQLGYECFGKEHSYNTLQEIEHKNLEQEAIEKPITMQEKMYKLYEPQESKNTINKSIIEKYSSFLED